MEVAVVSGALALVGAVLGSIVAGYVQRSVRERNARSERIEAAIRSVAVAMTARDITWGLHSDSAPSGFRDQDRRDLEKVLYREGLEKLASALADAKRDLAILTTDGHSIGNDWQNGTRLISALDDIYLYLLGIRSSERTRSRSRVA